TLLGTGGRAERACDLLQAVTRNVDGIAAGLAADWSGGRIDFRRAISRPGATNLYYKSHKEAALGFFQSLHDGLQAITDTRVKPVLGATLAAARPRLAEAIPSRRSARNIAISLAGLEALYLSEGRNKDTAGFTRLVRSQGHAKLDALMRRAFKLTLATARGIGKPLDVAVRDKRLRPRVAKLLLQVRALKQIVRTRLAPALGLTVGFNALDGD
ncbi:MAG TPA: imelysin family protein, partial [Devosiaceae bacterium]|nr:imelysin family protein [Devosiaceae bacterium]